MRTKVAWFRSVIAAGTLLAGPVGCGLLAGPPGRLAGTVAYLERVPPPPGATLTVSLEDTSRAGGRRAVVTRRAFRHAGRAPIPFVLEYDPDDIDPRHRYGLRAQIRASDGRLLWTSTAPHPVLRDGSRGGTARVAMLVRRVPAPVASQPGLQVFECDGGVRFTVRVQEGKAHVTLRDETVVLPRIPSGTGVRYSDGSDSYWVHGQVASLELGDKAWQDCRGNAAHALWEAARLRGVDFRAVGNEPAWQLEIERDRRIVLVTDAGKNQLSAPAPPPAVDEARRLTTYDTQAAAHRLRVAIEQAACADGLSGEPYPYRVTVLLDGAALHGCGRAL